jgi:hypothetical protein
MKPADSMMTANERLRVALQELLDVENSEGWLLDHYVVVMGVQKIDSDGKVTSASWLTAPEDQGDYVTMGLLDSAVSMQDATEEVEDD